jgi:Lysozyme like domain
MTAGRTEHRPVKIWRRGRHTTPSQVEKVAERAGKAAPAMAIAGALVAAPQAQHALTASAQPVPVSAAGWQWLYHENGNAVPDPNLIYPGQTLFVPADPPANFTLSSYAPKHAKTTTHVATHAKTSHSGGTVTVQSASRHTGSAASHTTSHAAAPASLSGTLGCSGLEQLWESAGGNPADAFMAAEIAMAESGGNQYALSPTDDYGYWQINASNGSLATFNAYGNARSAIILSDNGTDWSPWTTYASGAYQGRC